MRIPASMIARLHEDYHEKDVVSEAAKMAAWLDANPKRAPQQGGLYAFACRWLDRSKTPAKKRIDAEHHYRDRVQAESERRAHEDALRATFTPAVAARVGRLPRERGDRPA